MPQGAENLLTELNDFILQDISRRIARGAKITDTAEFQIYRAQSLGMSVKEIRKAIQEIDVLEDEEIDRIFTEAAERSDAFDRKVFKKIGDTGIPLEENTFLQNIIEAEKELTKGKFKNLTKTMGFVFDERNNTVHLPLTDAYTRLLDKAHLQIVTGAADYNSAIREAVNALGRSGVRYINYQKDGEIGSGYRIETVARRAVMSSVSRVTQKISEHNAETFGADGWEISAHAGARPSHAIHQGRQFPNSKYDSIVAPLINDYNCRHSAFPILIGISTPMYTDEQLAKIDPPPFTYEGKEYTAYEASAQQRRMEAAMRVQKDIAVCAKASGDDERFTAASIRLSRQREKYIDFSKKAGMYTQFERTHVFGFDRSLSGKASWAVRKELDKSTKGSIISIGHSSSHIAKNHLVKLPDGTISKLTEGTELTKIKTFAGNGTKSKIRDTPRLFKQYDVPESEWKKVRGNGFVDYKENSVGSELHWYESNKTGTIEMKVKRFFDES